jgi:hypothetical protein
VESETPLKSLDPHQDDNELEGNKREILSMILINNNQHKKATQIHCKMYVEVKN